MMSPLISQLIVIAFGLVVLGTIVYGKVRTSAIYALGLLVVVTAVAGAWLYNDRQANAAETQDDPTIVYQAGLPNFLLVKVEGTQQQPIQDDDSIEDLASAGQESATDSDASELASQPENEESAIDTTEPVNSDGELNTSDIDVDSADSSFIPLDGETVPAAVGVNMAGMPEWIGKGDYEQGEIDYRLVTAGPNYRLRDCEKELNQLMLQATAEYVDEWLEPGASSYVRYDIRYVKENLLVDGHRFSHEREYQVGPMHSSYAQLQFDSEFRENLTARWDQIRVKHRLIHTGIAGVGVLGLLITAFGYLRLDHATRGFYTGRLQFIAGGAILALAVAGAVAWQAIPWL